MQITFSKYDLQIRAQDPPSIFDVIRKKYVALTPEEWVRQHVIHYLLHDYHFPKSLISVEKQLTVNERVRRTDIVLYNRLNHPVLIVECKAPEVTLSQKTLDQIARYNLTLRVPWLWITNGTAHRLCETDLLKGSWRVAENLPLPEILLG